MIITLSNEKVTLSNVIVPLSNTIVPLSKVFESYIIEYDISIIKLKVSLLANVIVPLLNMKVTVSNVIAPLSYWLALAARLFGNIYHLSLRCSHALIASEYNQEISQSYTRDQPTAPRGRATAH